MEIIKCFEIEASFSLQSIEFKIEDYLHIKDRLSQGDNFRTIVKNNWRISLIKTCMKKVLKSPGVKSKLDRKLNSFKKSRRPTRRVKIHISTRSHSR